jgi:hypothetical protein
MFKILLHLVSLVVKDDVFTFFVSLKLIQYYEAAIFRLTTCHIPNPVTKENLQNVVNNIKKYFYIFLYPWYDI